jgi:hypothetical protein
MATILAAIALGLTGRALQARWFQQPPPAVPRRIADPSQTVTPHSRYTFEQDATACPGSKDPVCGSNIVIPVGEIYLCLLSRSCPQRSSSYLVR